MFSLYEECKHRKLVRNKENCAAANLLGEVVGTSDNDNARFKGIMEMIANDTWLKEKGIRTDLDYLARKWEGWADKYDKAQQKTAPPSPSTGKYPPYTNEEKKAFMALSTREERQEWIKERRERLAATA